MPNNTQSYLQYASVIEEAQQQSGLEDFGNNDFEAPLKLLLSSLREEADLHEQGCITMHERIVKLLLNRLRIESYFRRYPEINDEVIKAPIFIAAMTRTGTTMLHRFLASDPKNYAVLWYECRNPAPLEDSSSSKEDQRIALAQQEIQYMLKNYPGLDAIHPMDACAPDECIMLLEHTFCSGMPLAMSNVPSYNQWEHHTDHSYAYEYYKRILQFLQWQKKRAGLGNEDSRWVLKAPEHLGHIDIIFKLFSDATIIQSHRTPEKTIPSISSMIYSGWCAHQTEPNKQLIGQLWMQRLLDFSNHCQALRDERGSDAFIDLWYEDLINEPQQQAQKIYAALNMELDQNAKQAMDAWREANKREKRAQHQYSLEEYHLSSELLNQKFSGYIKEYLARPNN